MMRSKVVELSRSRGFDYANYADAYDGGFTKDDIPSESSIRVPYWGEHEPDAYKEAFQDGCQDFLDSQEESEEPSDPWPYADDSRDR